MKSNHTRLNQMCTSMLTSGEHVRGGQESKTFIHPARSMIKHNAVQKLCSAGRKHFVGIGSAMFWMCIALCKTFRRLFLIAFPELSFLSSTQNVLHESGQSNFVQHIIQSLLGDKQTAKTTNLMIAFSYSNRRIVPHTLKWVAFRIYSSVLFLFSCKNSSLLLLKECLAIDWTALHTHTHTYAKSVLYC